MKLAFFGTPEYAVPTLDALVEAGHELVCVVAQPDRPSGRGQKLAPPAVAARARELGLPLRQPRAIRSGTFPESFRRLELDVGVVVAYGRILTGELLSHPRWGMVNGHGSLLPRWRGAAPVEWALLSGDAETGVTTMQMDEGLDTGAMLLRRPTPISPEDDAGTLRERLSRLTAALMVETLARLPTLERIPQPEQGVTLAPPLTREGARLRWEEPATAVHNRVRAFSERQGGEALFRGEIFKLRRTCLAEGAGKPGEILEAGRRLVVACGAGAVEVIEGQLPGKRALPARDLVNGARIQPGEVLL